MSTEERVRTAIDAVARTVHDVRPLPFHPDTIDFDAPARPARPRLLSRWQGWLVPLAGAAAVVAVAATLVAVRGASGTDAASQGKSTATSSSAASGTGASDAIPPYYVAANDVNGTATNSVGVIDTRTGVLRATFKLPVNQAWSVAGSASDTTFVVNRGTNSDQPFSMDVLRVPAGSSGQATMTPLKLAGSFNEKVSTGSGSYTQNQVQALAVSPDGQTVAVMYLHVTQTKIEKEQVPEPPTTSGAPTTKTESVTTPTSVEAVLQTYSLATGQAQRTWTESGLNPATFFAQSFAGFGGLTWLADGHTLAWTTTTATPSATSKTLPAVHWEFELLNTASPGTSLTANSRLAFHILDNTACEQPLVTSDGKSVICGDADNNKVLELVSYSLSTGKVEHVLYQYKGSLEGGNVHAVWAPSGSLAIANGQVEVKSTSVAQGAFTGLNGIATPTSFTPLPVKVTGSLMGLSGVVF